MTLNTLRLRAARRAPAEATRNAQDHSLTYALCLILFLVFAPLIGAHIVFALLAEPARAQAEQGGQAVSPLASMGERSPS
ncbi:hypothetical protein [Microvirga roseola]|uniref:hypothetical protein n=1 Tax=Microvirga roseola TaxID=2883126 RepID=UPI001E625089|nr:hypothetical protein [Microvirga roseola]